MRVLKLQQLHCYLYLVPGMLTNTGTSVLLREVAFPLKKRKVLDSMKKIMAFKFHQRRNDASTYRYS